MCVYIYRERETETHTRTEIYYKELARVIMEARKSHDRSGPLSPASMCPGRHHHVTGKAGLMSPHGSLSSLSWLTPYSENAFSTGRANSFQHAMYPEDKRWTSGGRLQEQRFQRPR